MHSWQELNEDEREVVKRLPRAVDYAVAERQRMHRWCTRCWHEETSRGERSS